MKILIVVFTLLISIIECSPRNRRQPLCLSETNEGCNTEITELNEHRTIMLRSRFPPLTKSLEKFNELCRPVMDCASRLECFKDKPIEEVHYTSCQPNGVHEWQFETECLKPILGKIYKGNSECAKKYDFIIKNSTINKNAFVEGKECYLSIAKEVCKQEDYKIFQDNYDELMGLYTTKPVMEQSFCGSPYDKFHLIQCLEISLVQVQKLAVLPLLNVTDSDMKEMVDDFEKSKKCSETSCLSYMIRNDIDAVLEMMSIFEPEWKRTLKERPRLADFKCLQTIDFRKFVFDWYGSCARNRKDNKDCIIEQIASNCRNEILEDFKKPVQCSS